MADVTVDHGIEKGWVVRRNRMIVGAFIQEEDARLFAMAHEMRELMGRDVVWDCDVIDLAKRFAAEKATTNRGAAAREDGNSHR
jgi:hypothetical protein